MANGNTGSADASGWTQVTRSRRSARLQASEGEASSSEPAANPRSSRSQSRGGRGAAVRSNVTRSSSSTQQASQTPLTVSHTRRQAAPVAPRPPYPRLLNRLLAHPPRPRPMRISSDEESDSADSLEEVDVRPAPPPPPPPQPTRPPPPTRPVRQPLSFIDTWSPRRDDRLDPEAQYFRDSGGRSLMVDLGHEDEKPHSSKRSRQSFENEIVDSGDVLGALRARGASTVLLYRNAVPDPAANDIWPEYRSRAKLPAAYSSIDPELPLPHANKSKRRQPTVAQNKADKSRRSDRISKKPPADPAGRPIWNLPVELVELIAGHLDRDDIKALRMVSRELNYFVSQVIFQTVVVPFNTEIYGMVVPGHKPDTKGKKIANSNGPGFFWRNANGDEVYNGHGIDVFKGFGQHILKFGMSFEVTEESLGQPPVKSLTEKKTSFWGTYDWPYEEYCRFDAVAGLETAADETPRMKLAFSELTKVRELALSIDCGLGWLNGPDRSIRARILQQPTAVFGATKHLPDRRTQAQQQLWKHIEARHEADDENVKLSTLYRLYPARSFSELDDVRMLADEQPTMRHIEPQLIHEATPHVTIESFTDSVENEDFVLPSVTSDSGILFTSIFPPNDPAQHRSPVVPSSLTKAQSEWLLETEWAQHAFLSSYMLSVVDNSTTFSQIHTLNIARLSDRYLTTLDRGDFWAALPSLKNLTLMVVPGWRTVRKDSAGFVHTPTVNPTAGITTFCDLLINRVTQHPGIQNLTIGWADGGEHAEGLHARNKLLMPAPLIPSGMRTHGSAAFSADMLHTWEQNKLRVALLRFPHVEQLTLKNCWLTPMALLELVKIHDAMKLKNLILDSVSLTAVLKLSRDLGQAAAAAAAPQPNAAQGGGAAQPTPQNVHNNTQLLNWLLQSLQTMRQQINQMQQAQGNAGGAPLLAGLTTRVLTAMQHVHALVQAENTFQQRTQNQQITQGQQNAPTQQQLQQHQQNINWAAQDVTTLDADIQTFATAAAPAAQPAASPFGAESAVLHAAPRDGSWTSIIDQLSPGTNLADFGSTHSKSDPERQTALQTIEFKSCGYARLPNITYDQTPIDHGRDRDRNASPSCTPLLLKRYNALASAMLPAHFPHLGEIVQEIDPAEVAMLEAGWSFTTGWTEDMDPLKVEFDGKLPGGTGRISGRVCKSNKVAGGSESDPSKCVDMLKKMGV